MNDAEIASAPARRKRKAISSRKRFEIFKRDGFACQYCGGTPPNVLLEVDHVVAVANGGTNDDGNLVTSCEPCNRGKGAVPLGAVRPSMSVQAAALKEREQQIAGYAAVVAAQRARVEDQIWEIARALWGGGTGTIATEDYASIKKFLGLLTLPEMLEAVDIAWAGPARSDAARWKYLCGVCWNKIKEKQS